MKIPFDMIVACDQNNGIGINNQLPWRLPGDMKYFRELTIGASIATVSPIPANAKGESTSLRTADTKNESASSAHANPERTNTKSADTKDEKLDTASIAMQMDSLDLASTATKSQITDARSASSGDAEESRNDSHRNAVIMGRKTWHSIPDKFKPLADRLNIVLTRDPNYQLPGNVRAASSLDEALEIATTQMCSNVFLIGGSHIYADGLTNASCRRLYITQVLASFDCDVFFPIYKDRFHRASQSEVREENGIKYRWEVYERKD